MTENALAVRPDDVALEAYGDLAEVREMTKRLMAMLPSAKDLGPGGAGALAQASLAMGLNPFIGQIWAIPQGGKNKNGTYDTYGIMVGISGLRSKAHDQAKADGGMYTVHYRRAREDEIEGLTVNPGDIVRACDLTLSTRSARRHFEFTGEVPRFTGIGVYRKGERTKMNPLQNARKRAEAEAIKQAFDVPLSFEYGAAPVSGDVEIEDMPERYQEHGDGLVNGNARQATDELFGDYIDADEHNGHMVEGDGFLETDFRGTPKDADAHEDYREHLIDEAGHAADVAEAKRELDALEPEPHWITNPQVRTRFWAWTSDTLELDGEQVHKALGVESVKDFKGTMGEAKTAILNWNAARKKDSA